MVGIRDVAGQVWQVRFLEYGLGYLDRDEDRMGSSPNPFAPDKVLTMCPECGQFRSAPPRLGNLETWRI
jgi:hypothetical protein